MLREKNVKIDIINYIKNPPTKEELKTIASKLKLPLKDFLRKNDSAYQELRLDKFNGSDDEFLEIINKNPRILERPIITCNNKAVIGRPPENILKLFK